VITELVTEVPWLLLVMLLCHFLLLTIRVYYAELSKVLNNRQEQYKHHEQGSHVVVRLKSPQT
jgi:hypothetical protein